MFERKCLSRRARASTFAGGRCHVGRAGDGWGAVGAVGGGAGQMAAEAAGVRAGGDGAPCLAWGPGCELGDMPSVLSVPLRLGRPLPLTHFRLQP